MFSQLSQKIIENVVTCYYWWLLLCPCFWVRWNFYTTGCFVSLLNYWIFYKALKVCKLWRRQNNSSQQSAYCLAPHRSWASIAWVQHYCFVWVSYSSTNSQSWIDNGQCEFAVILRIFLAPSYIYRVFLAALAALYLPCWLSHCYGCRAFQTKLKQTNAALT